MSDFCNFCVFDGCMRSELSCDDTLFRRCAYREELELTFFILTGGGVIFRV